MKSTHTDYIERGFVVRDKIRLGDNEEGARYLLRIIDSIDTGHELVHGELVPEVVSESERNDPKFRYFVVYAPAGINRAAGLHREEEVKKDECVDSNLVAAVSGK